MIMKKLKRMLKQRLQKVKNELEPEDKHDDMLVDRTSKTKEEEKIIETHDEPGNRSKSDEVDSEETTKEEEGILIREKRIKKGKNKIREETEKGDELESEEIPVPRDEDLIDFFAPYPSNMLPSRRI